MACSKDTDEDIQVDAQISIDEDERVSSSQSSFHRQSILKLTRLNLKQSSTSVTSESTSIPRSLIYEQSARPFTSCDDGEHLLYLKHMTSELQMDICEILLINSENDMKAARRFQNHLQKDIKFNINNKIRSPRVELLCDVNYEAINNLDLAFPKALYVFLYVTEHFCEQQKALLNGQACLTAAIEDKSRNWSVIPVHTASRKNRRYKLPMMLNCLRAINYWNGSQDQFYVDSVRKMLESKIGLLLERERLLDEARKKYFMLHRAEILQNLQYMNGSIPSAHTQCSETHESDSKKSPCSSISSVGYCTLSTHVSLPDKQNEAVPENMSDVIERMDQIEVSGGNVLPLNNSNQSTNQEINQQPELLNIHIRSNTFECSPHGIAVETNSNNNFNSSFQNIDQNAPSGLPSREPDSSIVVDGPTDDENSLSSTNPCFQGFQHVIVPNTSATSSAHLRSSAPANAAQNTFNGIPTTLSSFFMNHAGYNIPNQEPYFQNNFVPQVLPPAYSYQGLPPPQYFPQNYAYHPYFNQFMHQHPFMPPYNMSQLYSFANPIPQNPFFHNPVRSHSQTNDQASDIETQQMFTNRNAPSSLRPRLSDISLAAVSGLGSLPDLSNQWSSPHFSTVNSTSFSHLINHPAAASSTKQQGKTFPTVAQQNQSHNPFSEGQEILHQEITGRNLPGSNYQLVQNTNRTISGTSTTATTNPVIQHIHHHHHKKNITVANANNVLIGDKSTFLNKDQLSEMTSNNDDSSDDTGETYEDESTDTSSTRLREDCSMTRSNPNVSEASRNGRTASHKNIEASAGFAECLSPVSTRQPVEGSLSSSSEVDDRKSETYCKKPY